MFFCFVVFDHEAKRKVETSELDDEINTSSRHRPLPPRLRGPLALCPLPRFALAHSHTRASCKAETDAQMAKGTKETMSGVADRVPVVRPSNHRWAVKLADSADPERVAQDLGFVQKAGRREDCKKD